MKIITLRQHLLNTAGGALAVALAALPAVASAQSPSTPPQLAAAQPSPDQGARNEAQSPADQAPEGTAPDPAVVETPDNPEEARN